jgi:hypothetical protein
MRRRGERRQIPGRRGRLPRLLTRGHTHGGMGHAQEYLVERNLREVLITRIAPVSPQLILSYLAERVLDLPKSY